MRGVCSGWGSAAPRVGVAMTMAVVLGVSAQAQDGPITMVVDGSVIEGGMRPRLVQESVFLPAREFLEALGAESEWKPETKEMTVRLPRVTAVFVLNQSTAKRNGQAVDEGLAFQLMDGKGFLPARLAARALECEAKWDASARRIEMTSLWSKQAVTAADVVRWARYLRGKPITIQGEYRGWSPTERGPGVDKGRPKRRADWILRDATGAIYVSGRSPLGLDPLDDIGSIVLVDGVGGLSKAQAGFVEAKMVTVVAKRGAASSLGAALLVRRLVDEREPVVDGLPIDGRIIPGRRGRA
ncbi:MAG TPA: copper amine oxidase N-terminal domain-containing protein [Armatimonadota bacterium]|nr:copper amine oxidase N-terminal domain-containing protein [Armatimonadota bacterium]